MSHAFVTGLHAGSLVAAGAAAVAAVTALAFLPSRAPDKPVSMPAPARTRDGARVGYIPAVTASAEQAGAPDRSADRDDGYFLAASRAARSDG